MNDKDKEYRIVGDRVITEEQYKSEKSAEAWGEVLYELSCRYSKIIVPITIIAMIVTFYLTWKSEYEAGQGWGGPLFISLLFSSIVGFLVGIGFFFLLALSVLILFLWVAYWGLGLLGAW